MKSKNDFQLPPGGPHKWTVKWSGKRYGHEKDPSLTTIQVVAKTAFFAKQEGSRILQVSPEFLEAKLVP
jgi:hypothetical protein